MLRTDLNESLKTSLKSRNACAVRTIRLILAAIKDRDISARSAGTQDPVGDPEILSLLQTMVRQRLESIAVYEENGREDLASGERDEVEVIRRFMPSPMDMDEVDAAIRDAIRETGARSMRDMSRTMALLKERYPGRMDFSEAGVRVRQALIG